MERALILSHGPELRPSELLTFPTQRPEAESAERVVEDNGPIARLEHVEKQHIARALAHFSGNYAQTARSLGISLSTIKRKVKQLNLA